MRHVAPPPDPVEPPASTLLGTWQRRTLAAIAEAALPAGRIFPGAGAHTIDKVEAFLGGVHDAAGHAAGAVLAALDGDALLHHRRTFASLTLAERLAILERWRGG